MVTIDISEEKFMWVVPNLSGASRSLGAEAIDLINWYIPFGCTSEDFKVVVSNMATWVTKSSPPPGHNI